MCKPDKYEPRGHIFYANDFNTAQIEGVSSSRFFPYPLGLRMLLVMELALFHYQDALQMAQHSLSSRKCGADPIRLSVA